ncbi:MAG TPA: ParB-like protein [Steroidobacteraceae bacterium]|nr:ParB-like protein [Steroidobacteraceae bacterium]
MPQPKIQRAAINSLGPTQLTVGMLEVEDKRKRLLARSPKDIDEFLQAHPVPAVIGPAKKLYITDHHHLARAALEAKIDQVYLEIEADLSTLALADFWSEMDKQCWVHPLDQNGVRHRYEFIPGHLDKLVDDVYRSLAGFVRDAGGYDKTPTAFAEFIWADFFRRHIAIEDVIADFQAAVHRGRDLARSSLAKRIPGYKG